MTLGEAGLTQLSAHDFERLIAELVGVGGIAPLKPSNGNPRCVDVIAKGPDNVEFVQFKTLRRRFTLDHEREALREAIDAYRTAPRRKLELLLNEQGFDEKFLSGLRLVAVAGEDTPGVLVVTRDGLRMSVLEERRGERSAGWLFVSLVTRLEGFILRVSKSAALKRVVMRTRAFFVPTRGLAHDAARSNAPPGHFVSASPHPTRGPNFPRMTADQVIRGMSLAHA